VKTETTVTVAKLDKHRDIRTDIELRTHFHCQDVGDFYTTSHNIVVTWMSNETGHNIILL